MPTKTTSLAKLTQNAKDVLSLSYEIALELGNNEVLPEYIFIAILDHKTNLAAQLLADIGVDLERTAHSLKARMQQTQRAIGVHELIISERTKQIITDSYYIAHTLDHVYVGTEHILLALLKDSQSEFVQELQTAGLTYDQMRDKLLQFGTYAPGVFMKSNDQESEDVEQPLIFGRDLTGMAEEGKLNPIFGRKKEVDRLVHILARRSKNNPILIGEPGVGKTAVVELFCKRIINGDVPEFLQDFKVIQIDVASIIAGSKVRGDVEEKLLAIIDDVISSSNKILFIDEIHLIVGAGTAGSGSLDIANTLKPYLTDSNIRIIGATTNAEFQKYFEEDGALTRRFQPLRIEELSKEATKKILQGMKGSLEEYHNVNIDSDAIEDAVKLSSRYIIDRYLPDKAIDVLDEAAASIKIQSGKSVADLEVQRSQLKKLIEKKSDAMVKGQYEKASEIQKDEKKIINTLPAQGGKKRQTRKRHVTPEHVKKVISDWAGVPITTITASDLRSIRGIEKRIASQVVGQGRAVKRVASALKRARVGLGDEARPLASFLFLGPTGVGKTEMAKVIAKEIFGDPNALIQVDMSEYMEQHSVSKIIGSPPGYVGHTEGGQLTEQIRQKPYSIVLFDEIEKAHPELINILLQILDEGRITDSKGREINFKNTIIAMTSNIGAEEIANDKSLGFDTKLSDSVKAADDEAYKEMREKLLAELKNELPPEFINRLDEVVIFKGLTTKDAQKISKMALDELVSRLVEKRIKFTFNRAVTNLIARKGFDEEYGARNIRRKVQEVIETQIADLFLSSSGKLKKVAASTGKNKDTLVFSTSRMNKVEVKVR